MGKKDKQHTESRKQAELQSRTEFLFTNLPDMTQEQLREDAVFHYESFHDKEVDPDSQDCFYEQIAVNYARHELLGYDAALRNRPSHLSKRNADRVALKTALAMIAAKYPWLAEECNRQSKGR